jgi:hypothetical protein
MSDVNWKSDGSLVCIEDCSWVFFPRRSGFLTAHQLREIADELDQRNTCVAEKIEKALGPEDGVEGSVDSVARMLALTGKQKEMMMLHGTPAEFAKGVYEIVPKFISMGEAEAAIRIYQGEWERAGKDVE